jgi:predicted alpha/beta superfamily hydrolase
MQHVAQELLLHMPSTYAASTVFGKQFAIAPVLWCRRKCHTHMEKEKTESFTIERRICLRNKDATSSNPTLMQTTKQALPQTPLVVVEIRGVPCIF